MARIVAVIVTYNRKELLLQCLECLRAQEVERGIGDSEARKGESVLDILVVDNASTDGTEKALADMVAAGTICYFNTGENLGGAGGFNCGMREAVLAGYDYLWVMDDDCLPHPDSLQKLIDADAELKGDYGFLSSVVQWKDGSPCAMNVQRYPLTHDISDFPKHLQPCALASFVSLFVPARIVVEVGLPIKEFFIWTDDWDFTRRISRIHPCYVVGDSIVTHASKTNGAGTIFTDSSDRLDRYRMVYRNDIVLYRGEGAKGFFYVVSRALYHMGKVIVSPGNQKMKKLGIIVSSNFAGLGFHPAIEYVDSDEIASGNMK